MTIEATSGFAKVEQADVSVNLSTTTTVERRSGDPLLDRFAGNYSYEQGEDGSTQVKSDQRSSFEGRGADGFNKNYHAGTVTGASVEKKPWWGREGYEKQVWSGNRQASEGMKVSGETARRSWWSGKKSPAGGTTHSTGPYATGSASEQGRRIGRPRNSEVQNRRADYPQPDIIHWEQQREMDLEQTRGILGR